MGQLVTLDQLNQGLGWTWHFRLAEFENKRPKLPCSTFPFSLAINNHDIEEQYVCTYDLKSRILEWVKGTSSEYVILDIIKKDYYHSYGRKYNSGGYNVDWGYHVFYFRTEEEQLMFKLAFSEQVSDILPYDPDKPPNYIQSAVADLQETTESLEKAYQDYKDASKKKDRATLEELRANFDAHLLRWDGSSTLTFTEDGKESSVEVEKPELFRVYRCIYRHKSAVHQHDSIMDIHSTFVPKARF